MALIEQKWCRYNKPNVFNMKRFFCYGLVLCCLSFMLQAQNPTANIVVTDLESDAQIVVTGNVNTGETMPLKWAENSAVACFPATRFYEFRGNHVLYRVTLPAASAMTITLTPKNKRDRINVYALRLGANSTAIPPAINKAISCEAAYPLYAGKPNLRAANTAKEIDFISVNKDYTILIGVAGAKEVLNGAYELRIETVDR